MRFCHRKAFQYGRNKCRRERIPGTDSISHIHLQSLGKRDIPRDKHIASVDSAGQNQHPETIFGKQNAASVLETGVGTAEQTAHCLKLLIVNFQYIAFAQRIAQDFPGIEILPEVDVEYLQYAVVFRHGIQETADGIAGNHAAPGKRPEAHSTSPGCKFLEPGSIRDIVPCHPLLYVIARHSVGIKPDLYRTGRIRHGLDHGPEPFGFEIVKNLFAGRVISDSAHDHAVEPELRNMICKICRRTAEFFSFGKHIPEGFSDSDHYIFHFR